MSRPVDERIDAAIEVRRVLNPDLTLFEILGVAPGVCGAASLTHADLAMRRRFATRRCHPDAWAGGTEAELRDAHAAMVRVNTAYETLSDEKKLKLYLMTELRKTHRPCGRCGALGHSKRQKGFTKFELILCDLCRGFGYMPTKEK